MDVQRRRVGTLAVIFGALLATSLSMTWWGPPPLFDDPSSLPGDAAFTAEALADGGAPFAPDGFELFDGRDILWLVAGLVTFGFGLMTLNNLWIGRIATMALAALVLVAALALADALISPPDFEELGPNDSKHEYSFSIDLPLGRAVGSYVGMGAAIGCLAAYVLALRSGPRLRATA